MTYHLQPGLGKNYEAEEPLSIHTTPAIMMGILRSMIDSYQFLLKLQEELPPSAREWGELPIQLQRLRYAIGQLMVLSKMELKVDLPQEHSEARRTKEEY